MNTSRGTERPGSTRPGNSGPLESLVLEILGAFFDLRAAGQEHGLVTSSGAGNWGLMRILREEGPKTVPEIARMRAVSRQYIQKLANELIDQGFVEMVENPRHRRSRLMRLTARGEGEFARLSAEFRQILGGMATTFRPTDLETASQTIRTLRTQLARLRTRVEEDRSQGE